MMADATAPQRPAAPLIWHLVDTSGIGGIERHIATLTASLRQRGLDVRVVLYQDHGPNPWLAQLEAAGLTPRHLDGTIAGLYRALRQERPALVHTHGYKAGILGRLAARALAIPSASTFHMGETSRWPVSLYAAVDAWTSLLSERIAVSNAIRAKLPYRATVIANYMAMPREMPAFPPPPRRIGYVGRLSHEKAPDRFCALARQFAAENTTHNIEWHVFGDGPMRAALEAEYAGQVTFHGMVTDMAATWSDLGLCVMPSRGEGLPMAALEALAAGVPIVAADVGDLSKVAIEGISGWLCPGADQDAFAAAIQSWLRLSDVARSRLRRTAWQHAKATFSEDASLAALLEVYARQGVRVPA